MLQTMKGHCDVVKCFLSSGADFNLRDVGGQSPLIAASSSGYYDIVRLLTAHGALRDENDSNVILKYFHFALLVVFF
jgi:ankyrin repeat protein